MGCGCGGAAAKAQQEHVVVFSDGSVSKRYANENEARIALGRSGKTGLVKPAS